MDRAFVTVRSFARLKFSAKVIEIHTNLNLKSFRPMIDPFFLILPNNSVLLLHKRTELLGYRSRYEKIFILKFTNQTFVQY